MDGPIPISTLGHKGAEMAVPRIASVPEPAVYTVLRVHQFWQRTTQTFLATRLRPRANLFKVPGNYFILPYMSAPKM